MAKWCKTLMVSLILVGLPKLALTQDKPEAAGVTQDKPEAGIMQDKSMEMEQETAELQVVRDAFFPRASDASTILLRSSHRARAARLPTSGTTVTARWRGSASRSRDQDGVPGAARGS